MRSGVLQATSTGPAAEAGGSPGRLLRLYAVTCFSLATMT